jgi:hypothetical protein
MNTTRQTNLHTMWDSDMITVRVQQEFSRNNSRYYDYLQKLMGDQAAVDNDDSIDQWIKENIKFVCEGIYLDENNATMNTSTNFTLSEVYYRRHISLIEQRLALGGRRLGALLNRLAKNPPKPPAECYNGSTSTQGVISRAGVTARRCSVHTLVWYSFFVLALYMVLIYWE